MAAAKSTSKTDSKMAIPDEPDEPDQAVAAHVHFPVNDHGDVLVDEETGVAYPLDEDGHPVVPEEPELTPLSSKPAIENEKED